jgi:hypothetical protein
MVCAVADKACQKREKKKLGRVQGQLVQPKVPLDGKWLLGKEVFRPRPGCIKALTNRHKCRIMATYSKQ